MLKKNKKKVGRPSKLTPEIRDKIVEMLKIGNYIETVCEFVDINKSTYYMWLKQAEVSTRSTKYSKFRDAVRKAMAFAEARDVAIIARAAEKDWRAAVWMLERRYPERWGKPGAKGRKSDFKNEMPQQIEKENEIREEDKPILKEALDLFAMGETDIPVHLRELVAIIANKST